MPSSSGWPSDVRARVLMDIAPPLRNTPSRRGSAASSAAASSTAPKEPSSSTTVRTCASGVRARIASRAPASRAAEREASTTSAPAAASCSAAKYPMPAVAPVTTTVRPSWRGGRAASQVASPVPVRWVVVCSVMVAPSVSG